MFKKITMMIAFGLTILLNGPVYAQLTESDKENRLPRTKLGGSMKRSRDAVAKYDTPGYPKVKPGRRTPAIVKVRLRKSHLKNAQLLASL